MPNDVNAANREPQGLPTRMAVDANGFCWRVFDGEASWTRDGESSWSMARTNPDNDPIPEPVTYYVPQSDRDHIVKRFNDLRKAVQDYANNLRNDFSPSAELEVHDLVIDIQSLLTDEAEANA